MDYVEITVGMYNARIILRGFVIFDSNESPAFKCGVAVILKLASP